MDPYPFVRTPSPFQDDPGQIERQRNRDVLGQFVVFENELAVGPQEAIVNALFGLESEQVLQLFLFEKAFLDEDLTKRLLVTILLKFGSGRPEG